MRCSAKFFCGVAVFRPPPPPPPQCPPQKRYSCGNIGYARKINIHKNGWAKIPKWYGKATPFDVAGAFFSSRLLIAVTLWNFLLFIDYWPILKISVSTNSHVKPCRWKRSLSNVLVAISNMRSCAWENGRITDNGFSSFVADFLSWIQMVTASRAVNVTRSVMWSSFIVLSATGQPILAWSTEWRGTPDEPSLCRCQCIKLLYFSTNFVNAILYCAI